MSGQAELKAGAVILGRFELVAPLARHGAGEVWKARDPSFKDRVSVLKFLCHTRDGSAPEALQEVVSRLRALRHPNLAATTSCEVWEDRVFLVQGWFEGVSLPEALRAARAGDREPPRAVLEKLCDQLCAALEVIHASQPPSGHGALYPGCVLVRGVARGELDVQVTDAEVAPFVEGGTGFNRSECVAPELARSAAMTPHADVYALGMILREVLRETSKALPHVVPFESYAGRRDVPAEVWDAVARATSHDPAGRQGSAGVLRGELLRGWKSARRLEARRQTAPAPVAKSARPEKPASSQAPPLVVLPVATPAHDAPPVAAEVRAENPWATGVLRREVSAEGALEQARGQVGDFTLLQEPPVENPWATGVLQAKVNVEEEVIPTALVRPPETRAQDATPTVRAYGPPPVVELPTVPRARPPAGVARRSRGVLIGVIGVALVLALAVFVVMSVLK
jgi:hypothetical protein